MEEMSLHEAQIRQGCFHSVAVHMRQGMKKTLYFCFTKKEYEGFDMRLKERCSDY